MTAMFGPLTAVAYQVGGCVRDMFLGVPSKDSDFVMEATEAEFRRHFPTVPRVGKTKFPVFVVNKDEVALTRADESTGNGYHDFNYQPGTILDDLGRRDFTINSIARHVATGDILDPHNGRQDIEARLLRSVNEQAFTEDATRILRGARFFARFHRFGFTFEEQTLARMREAVPFLAAVNGERVVKELVKLYSEAEKPSLFFTVLRDLGALEIHFKPLAALVGVPAGPKAHHGDKDAFEHTMDTIDRCKAKGGSFAAFIALLCHDFGKAMTPAELLPRHFGHEKQSLELAKALVFGLPFPKQVRQLTLLVAEKHMAFHRLAEMRPGHVISFVRDVRPNFRDEFVLACSCDHEPSAEQAAVFRLAERALAATEVIPPREVLAQGEQATREYVNARFIRTFCELRSNN